MADLTLYHAAPSRSSIVHWMLEELGEPYDIHLVSFKKGENRTPDYLAINPMGKVPALRHRDVVITEASAICAYLADEFPRAKLNVPVGNPKRGVYLKWLFFGPSCVEPAIWERAYPRKEPIEAFLTPSSSAAIKGAASRVTPRLPLRDRSSNAWSRLDRVEQLPL